MHRQPQLEPGHSYPTTSSEAPAPSKSGGRVVLIVGLLAGLGLAGIVGLQVTQALQKRKDTSEERHRRGRRAGQAPAGLVVSPTPMRWKPRVEPHGHALKPWREAEIGFRDPGTFGEAFNVATGDTVKAGALLAVLDASRAGAQVNQAVAQTKAAEANLAIAEDNLRRTDALIATKSIPEAQAEQARQQVALARAQLEGARATTNLAQQGAGMHSIVAPFAGVVTRAPTAIGSVVNPGRPADSPRGRDALSA
ncbi:MAG: hypothetical protein IPQ09_22995 [Myxococcales bacterium]|nr:hypothetical protein [Myxococcales bacterium]